MKKYHIFSVIWSLILCLSLCLSMLPYAALAEAGGSTDPIADPATSPAGENVTQPPEEENPEEVSDDTIEAPFGVNLVFECTAYEGLSFAVEMGGERRLLQSPSADLAAAAEKYLLNAGMSEEDLAVFKAKILK